MKSGVKYLWFLLIAAMLGGCVGNKKLAYLQDKEAKGNERFHTDAVITNPMPAYHLKPGDVLYINMEKFRVGEEIFSISSFQQMSRMNQIQHPYVLGHQVDAEGNLTLPLLGRIEVAGKTVNELREELNGLAAKQYAGSVVEIFQLDGMVSIVGEVNQPGRYPIFKERNTIFDAIALAGDLKDYADRSEVKIVREQEGQQTVFHIDLNDLDALGEKGFYVQNDDVIVVTPLKRRKYVTTNIQWLISSVTALVAIASLVVSISR
jgi:polysaccharide export outer membrane protein